MQKTKRRCPFHKDEEATWKMEELKDDDNEEYKTNEGEDKAKMMQKTKSRRTTRRMPAKRRMRKRTELRTRTKTRTKTRR